MNTSHGFGKTPLKRRNSITIHLLPFLEKSHFRKIGKKQVTVLLQSFKSVHTLIKRIFHKFCIFRPVCPSFLNTEKKISKPILFGYLMEKQNCRPQEKKTQRKAHACLVPSDLSSQIHSGLPLTFQQSWVYPEKSYICKSAVLELAIGMVAFKSYHNHHHGTALPDIRKISATITFISKCNKTIPYQSPAFSFFPIMWFSGSLFPAVFPLSSLLMQFPNQDTQKGTFMRPSPSLAQLLFLP